MVYLGNLEDLLSHFYFIWSHFKRFEIYYILFSDLFLASNINLLTHYAKGTLSLFVYFSLELLIKLLFQIFPSRYFFTVAYISYLALEKGFPRFKQNIFPFYFKGFSVLIFDQHYQNLIWFFFLKLVRYFNSLRL